MKAVACKKLHPMKAGELVVAQGGFEPSGGRDGLDAGKVAEFSGEGFQLWGGHDAEAV